MIGLDIGTYSIKGVELQRKDNAFILSGLQTCQRPPGEDLEKILKKFLSESNFTSRDLNISVAGHLAFVRLLEVPEMSDEELKNVVKLEIERFIPFGIEEALFDYHCVSKDAQAKKTMVLLAATKKDVVKNYVDIISQAGFRVKAVDVDGIAITNAFINTYPEYGTDECDKAFCLLNIGDAVLTMCIVYRGIPFVLRDISSAGAELSAVIMKSLGVDKKAAYELKHNPPADKKETILEIMRPVFNKFAKEVRLSIGYFENQYSKGVETLYISGGSSRIPDLKNFLLESLDIPVEFWDPFRSIQIDEKISPKSVEDLRQELVVGVGLAIRDD